MSPLRSRPSLRERLPWLSQRSQTLVPRNSMRRPHSFRRSNSLSHKSHPGSAVHAVAVTGSSGHLASTRATSPTRQEGQAGDYVPRRKESSQPAGDHLQRYSFIGPLDYDSRFVALARRFVTGVTTMLNHRVTNAEGPFGARPQRMNTFKIERLVLATITRVKSSCSQKTR